VQGLLEEARYFDPTLIPLVLRLHGGEAHRFPRWSLLVNEACRAPANGTTERGP
jgi:hypothetical protein